MPTIDVKPPSRLPEAAIDLRTMRRHHPQFWLTTAFVSVGLVFLTRLTSGYGLAELIPRGFAPLSAPTVPKLNFPVNRAPDDVFAENFTDQVSFDNYSLLLKGHRIFIQ